MADELDDFLKQAAQRRMQRQQEKQTRQSPNNPNPNPNSTNPNNRVEKPTAQKTAARVPKNTPAREVAQPRPNLFDEEQRLADRALEPSIAQRHVTTQIDQADEGIEAYVRSTIGEASTLGSLHSRPKGEKKGAPKSKSANKSDERPTIQQRPNEIVDSSEFVRQLRDPKTLRMAILAHEILRRPYQ
jgi:hypothetical protein